MQSHVQGVSDHTLDTLKIWLISASIIIWSYQWYIVIPLSAIAIGQWVLFAICELPSLHSRSLILFAVIFSFQYKRWCMEPRTTFMYWKNATRTTDWWIRRVQYVVSIESKHMACYQYYLQPRGLTCWFSSSAWLGSSDFTNDPRLSALWERRVSLISWFCRCWNARLRWVSFGFSFLLFRLLTETRFFRLRSLLVSRSPPLMKLWLIAAYSIHQFAQFRTTYLLWSVVSALLCIYIGVLTIQRYLVVAVMFVPILLKSTSDFAHHVPRPAVSCRMVRSTATHKSDHSNDLEGFTTVDPELHLSTNLALEGSVI